MTGRVTWKRNYASTSEMGYVHGASGKEHKFEGNTPLTPLLPKELKKEVLIHFVVFTLL